MSTTTVRIEKNFGGAVDDNANMTSKRGTFTLSDVEKEHTEKAAFDTYKLFQPSNVEVNYSKSADPTKAPGAPETKQQQKGGKRPEHQLASVKTLNGPGVKMSTETWGTPTTAPAAALKPLMTSSYKNKNPGSLLFQPKTGPAHAGIISPGSFSPLGADFYSTPVTCPPMQLVEYTDFDKDMFELREKKLVQKIVDIMNSDRQNPKKGSIPSERVQNCIKQKYADLYASVVGSEYANQWHRFIKNHPDQFQLIFPEEDGRSLPRIRMVSHTNYKEADEAEALERQTRERTIVKCLQYYLAEHEDDVSVEEFMQSYPNLDHRKIDSQLAAGSPPTLPRFRDLIRIIKRYPNDFSYDGAGGSTGPRIRTAKTWTPPAETREKRLRNPTSPLDSSQGEGSFTRSSSMGSPFTAPSVRWMEGIHTPYQGRKSEIPDSDPHLFPAREQKLKTLIMHFLESPTQNPYQGSVPSERVQNCIKAQQANLYKSVVGAGYANMWHKFIQNHGDVFHLFNVEDDKRAVWRIRLEKHTNWQKADEREKEERAKRDRHLLTCLTSFLEQHEPPKCKVDEFVEAYKGLPQNVMPLEGDPPPALPARGDFVRFVRRHSDYFSYNSELYEITMVNKPNLALPIKTTEEGSSAAQH